VNAPIPSDSTVRIGIAVAGFNESITTRLLAGAEDALKRGLPEAERVVHWVPGCFELAQHCSQLAASGRYSGLIALGCLLRGGTDHYEYLASGTTIALSMLSTRIDIPLTFGVLTCSDTRQARERAGGGEGNKGADAAEALIWMLDLRAGRDPELRREALKQRAHDGGK
jgi:6,7-dimethyl-8-ribityllumazine synthase